MKEISPLRNMTLSELVGETDSNRQQGNLSSAIRPFVLDYFEKRAVFHLAKFARDFGGSQVPALVRRQSFTSTYNTTRQT